MRSSLAAACLGIALAMPAAAHGPSRAASDVPGPNGGLVATADGHPIEMVAGPTELVFFLENEPGKPMASDGMSGRAIVTREGSARTVRLSAAPPNRLAGPLSQPLSPGDRIVFSARIHGHDLQARFVAR